MLVYHIFNLACKLKCVSIGVALSCGQKLVHWGKTKCIVEAEIG